MFDPLQTRLRVLSKHKTYIIQRHALSHPSDGRPRSPSDAHPAPRPPWPNKRALDAKRKAYIYPYPYPKSKPESEKAPKHKNTAHAPHPHARHPCPPGLSSRQNARCASRTCCVTTPIGVVSLNVAVGDFFSCLRAPSAPGAQRTPSPARTCTGRTSTRPRPASARARGSARRT